VGPGSPSWAPPGSPSDALQQKVFLSRRDRDRTRFVAWLRSVSAHWQLNWRYQFHIWSSSRGYPRGVQPCQPGWPSSRYRLAVPLRWTPSSESNSFAEPYTPRQMPIARNWRGLGRNLRPAILSTVKTIRPWARENPPVWPTSERRASLKIATSDCKLGAGPSGPKERGPGPRAPHCGSIRPRTFLTRILSPVVVIQHLVCRSRRRHTSLWPGASWATR